MSEDIEDGRPFAIYDGGGGLKCVLDEKREVAGFRSDGGFIFVLTSHGITTRVCMSREAFSAMVGIANALIATANELPRKDEVSA